MVIIHDMESLLRQHFAEIIALTDAQWAVVSQAFTYKKYRKHQFLIQEGAPVPTDFWIVQGLVKSYYTNADGKEHILQFATSDWWVCDYNGYFKQVPAKLNIDCLEDTHVFCITLEKREKLFEQIPELAQFFLKKSNGGYIALQRRILSLLNDNAKERYEQFQELYPELSQRLPKTLIASYLGVSRETLSRLDS